MKHKEVKNCMCYLPDGACKYFGTLVGCENIPEDKCQIKQIVAKVVEGFDFNCLVYNPSLNMEQSCEDCVWQSECGAVQYREMYRLLDGQEGENGKH